MKQSALAACEDMKGCVTISAPSVVDQSSRRERSAVVCPKPRRLGLINPSVIDPNRPLRRHVSNQEEIDAKAGAELLDLIVSKGVYGDDQSSVQIASSPPFFGGSPPSRVSNPLIQDARFGDERVTPLSPRAIIPIPSGLSVPPNPSARKNGAFLRGNFGSNPAVRVEGFDCLDRDGGRNRSIPAWA